MIQIIGVTEDNRLDLNVSINDLNISAYKWYWVDFNGPTEEEITKLIDVFHFHPLAVEDCVHRLQRPKLDYYDNHAFYVTHILRKEEGELMKEELDFFVGDNFIVTFHSSPAIEVSQVWTILLSHKKIEKWDTYYVFYQILDKIVDNYFPLLYSLEDDLDKIEDNTQNKSMNALMEELFDARYSLLNLRHTVHPMRDLLYRMLNSHHLKGINARREYFSDIYDHLLKLSEMVMSNREITADIRDSYLSLNSHQTNNVMKVLTIITSIFSPLTFIAGIYGMNFEHMPELSWRYGYLFSLTFMIVLGVIMILWFKRKGWFK
ncbi:MULTISPECIES: magnesium/cobalt transporter CorA [Bacillaceae]|uniref:magnesium/cobalt transporter CorA n=1 Tax=Bacillaceae TaxID=186817 RepID=UPI001E4266E7|nr:MULTISPECIES: magnesium/cobalt transporter CorA [Bacillaceae]MCE4047713.1 magnesium/cobalt transporter CorA [Bacillus sp. Au-Bac7]MCM3031160.1 magnesium/cobalt transporter CorA [Niallia sp. MER 6]MDL0434737.1 magnesium/cobalt transporter CorA [Niallia sp. SS-2023]UPO85951.1 magnesium/cobalt transporter CorA [Niallia sp. Man26]